MSKRQGIGSETSIPGEMDRFRRESDDRRIMNAIGEIFMSAYGDRVAEVCDTHERLAARYLGEVVDPLRKVWILRQIEPVDEGEQQGVVSNGDHGSIVLEFPIDVGETTEVLAPVRLLLSGGDRDYGTGKVAEFHDAMDKLGRVLSSDATSLGDIPRYRSHETGIPRALVYFDMYSETGNGLISISDIKATVKAHGGRLKDYTTVDRVGLSIGESRPLTLMLRPGVFRVSFAPLIEQEVIAAVMGILSAYKKQELLDDSHNPEYIAAVMRESVDKTLAPLIDSLGVVDYLLRRIKDTDFFKRNASSHAVQDACSGPQDAVTGLQDPDSVPDESDRPAVPPARNVMRNNDFPPNY